MILNDDLMRSYLQFQNQKKIGHIHITIFHKVMLSLIFLGLLPLSLLNILNLNSPAHKKKTKLFVFPFTDQEPMHTIIEEFESISDIEIIVVPTAIPILPHILLKDFYITFMSSPIWTMKNLDFFGALSLKISKYYGYKVKYGMTKLLLFQEYSFYSSYLTRIFEYEGGDLYNLMHGIPGKEASFFRFTKCFVWGTYFKDYYIHNNAEVTQFIVSGSIFHYVIKNNFKNEHTVDIDILYVMQGGVEEMTETMEALNEMVGERRVRYIQHPRYVINMPDSKVSEVKDRVLNVLSRSKIVISHYSTTLLDAIVMDKSIISYLKKDSKYNNCVSYIKEQNVVHSKEDLIHLINEKTEYINKDSLDETYIDLRNNPLVIICNKIFNMNR